MTASMAGEHTESEAHGEGSSNGVSNGAAAPADVRAAFLAGELGDESAKPAKGGKPAPAPVPKEETDDDSDLEDEDGDAEEVDDGSDSEETDDDSDLDEDEDDKPDEDDKADSETQKRIAQVRRTDKRIREQRERDFKAREVELESKLRGTIEQWQPRIEAAEKFERLAERAKVDPVAALKALGVGEEHYEYVGKLLYNLSKSKDDPKAREAMGQLIKERERDEELANLKKWREDSEKNGKEREQTAAADRELDSYFGKVAKATSDKTPLAGAYIKANPTEARERMQVLAFRIAKESGSTQLPKERAVIIALEKDRRRVLRELGIDPKSRGAAAASASATDSNTTTTSKKNDKKKPDDKTSVKTDDTKLAPRDEFLRS